MNNRWYAAAAAASALILAGSAAACSADSGDEPSRKNFYVSLGDSLAVGVQPDEGGTLGETKHGYTDALYRMLYDQDSTLAHKRLGCGGEDTTTFVNGGLEPCADRYERDGSQLARAERFLKKNRGSTALVTVGIGANNFTGCVMAGGADGGDGGRQAPALDSADAIDVDRGCVEDGLDRLKEEMPVIAARLREAAGPGVQIIGMTYYNPFLAALLLDGGATGPPGEGGSSGDGWDDGDGSNELVDYATGVFEEMNATITESYTGADIAVADVAAAFDSAETEVPENSETGMPANVQRICDYTWMCNTTRGPDIHTNQTGAQQIAQAFAEQVDQVEQR